MNEAIKDHPLNKGLAWLLLVIGVFHLADWLYGGRTDLHDALAGTGFLVVGLGGLAARSPRVVARLGRARLRVFMFVGALLVVTGIVLDWF